MKKTISVPTNRIRELRQAQSLTLRQLAEKIGQCTDSQLEKLESGETKLNLIWMRRISRALKVTPGELLHVNDNPLVHLYQSPELVNRLSSLNPEEMDKLKAMIDLIIDKKTNDN